MKCPKCGAELSDDTKFCSYCGEKLEHSADDLSAVSTANYEKSDTNEADTKSPKMKGAETKTCFSQKLQDKGVEMWNNLSILGKIATVAIVLFTLLCLVAFLFGKTYAGVIALVQIVLIIVTLLMKKQIIKVPKSWLHIVPIIFACMLLVPYFSIFNEKEIDANKFDWSDIALCDAIPEPKSHLGNIYRNSDEYLSLNVYKTSEKQYSNYIEACKDKGFSVDVEQLGSSFHAFNESGYKLSLSHFNSNERMDISVDTPVKLRTLEWPKGGLALLIPAPQSNIGKIEKNDETGFTVLIGDNPLTDFKGYTKSCFDMGFTVDMEETEKHFFAKNSDGYKLTVEYQGNSTVSISIDEPEYKVDIEVVCVENWIFSKYDVEVYVDDSHEGTLVHGATETYSLILKKGTHKIKFVSDEDNTVTGEASLDLTKDELLKYKISCSSSEIDVDTPEETSNENDTNGNGEVSITESFKTEAPQITVTMSEDEFMGMNYSDAEKLLREMGFTIFEYQILETDDQSKPDDTIGAVEIKSWIFGKGDFSKGDIYESDAIVVLWYFDCEEKVPNLTVENCEELATILSLKAESDPSYVSFASKYKGRTIEFNGSIDYLTHHENYKTRYEMLVSVGDYDENHQIGPTFKFEEIATYEIDYGNQDQVIAGTNVHIIAEVESFNINSQLFFLKPVLVSVR